MEIPKPIIWNISDPTRDPSEFDKAKSFATKLKGNGSKKFHPLLLTSCNLLTRTARLGNITAITNIPNTQKN